MVIVEKQETFKIHGKLTDRLLSEIAMLCRDVLYMYIVKRNVTAINSLNLK